jgi:hypothetical protein
MQALPSPTTGLSIALPTLVALIGCGGISSSASPSAAADSGPGGADGGGLALGGSFHAFPLNAVDGTGFLVTPTTGNPDVKSELKAFFSDKPGLCSTGVVRQNETIFAIDAVSGTAAFQPGTFTEMQQEVPGQVDVTITRLDATCSATAPSRDYGAESGTVVITSVTASAVAGTFDVTLSNDGGTLTGSFDVPMCEQPFSNDCRP